MARRKSRTVGVAGEEIVVPSRRTRTGLGHLGELGDYDHLHRLKPWAQRAVLGQPEPRRAVR